MLDSGDGAEFCTGLIMESAPPQCGGDLREITGWNWGLVEYAHFESARWGEYMFTGIDHGDRIDFSELSAR